MINFRINQLCFFPAAKTEAAKEAIRTMWKELAVDREWVYEAGNLNIVLLRQCENGPWYARVRAGLSREMRDTVHHFYAEESVIKNLLFSGMGV